MLIKVELLKDGRTAIATFTLPLGERVKVDQLRQQVENLGYQYLGYWVD